METLNQLWIRIVDSLSFGTAMMVLASVGVHLLTRKDIGHRRWIQAGVVFVAARALASFTVAWDIYHRATKFISITSTVNAAISIVFAYYTCWVLKDLATTLCHSENAERRRQDRERDRQQKSLNSNYVSYEAERKTQRLLTEVLAEKRG